MNYGSNLNLNSTLSLLVLLEPLDLPCTSFMTVVLMLVQNPRQMKRCHFSSPETSGRHEHRWSWLLLRQLDCQHVWISQQPELSWCTAKTSQSQIPLGKDMTEAVVFVFSYVAGRGFRPRRQKCQVSGQQNDVCSQVKVGECEREDDQLHWEHFDSCRQVRERFFLWNPLTLLAL